MTVKQLTLYTITCVSDGCGRELQDVVEHLHHSPCDARRDAEAEDWTTNGRTDVEEKWHCNRCAPWCWRSCGRMAGDDPASREYYCTTCWAQRCEPCGGRGSIIDGDMLGVSECPGCGGNGFIEDQSSDTTTAHPDSTAIDQLREENAKLHAEREIVLTFLGSDDLGTTRQDLLHALTERVPDPVAAKPNPAGRRGASRFATSEDAAAPRRLQDVFPDLPKGVVRD